MEYSLSKLRFPLALMAVLVMSACGKTPDTAASMPAAKVSVAKVLEQPVNEWDEFTGRLEAPETVEIRPRVSGQIDNVAFTEGALVKKGDLLFQIDPRPFQAEVRRLEAQLSQARATATRSENEAKRGERLRLSNAISAELADSRTSAAQEARAAAAAIQAQLDLAKLNLSFTRVTSPISGRVSRADITAGNLVTADVTPLTSVVSTDKVYAYFDADERVFLKYTRLAREGQRGQATPVYMGLSNEEGNPHLGHMNFIDNQVNPQTGTIRGRAVFDNKDGAYTPGLYARLKLVGSGTYSAVLINDEAVGTDLGKKFVLVMDADNKPAYRAVELGPKIEGLRIVRNGLSKDDTIIVKGLQRARPGTPVTPETVPMASEETIAALAQQRKALEASNLPQVAPAKAASGSAGKLAAATPRG
ncbi:MULTISPECIES: multidrug efflux RND transporter periplasmic adaptor subunit MexE [Pseudomonas]|jgi:multidrug efflux system membrane fusion protein|uniref:Efflux RND transporter periplasmic adaptor subunit n=1 Tax=Pseudomonas rhizophila TaxID=2045200 RepID=A0ABN5JUK2_9PSED|nr:MULTISPECIES: efflux RND transporter periplasmic adaptor subunit [Pseudomonas]AVU76861.1 efflux RND transporter periplasmic adaptor subunit [Pseudomonas rhizophila]MEA1027856.1 efflux RND transporter periplasmic adaptor subunit [Pseudomonas sp. N-137]QKJ35991.1 efflux RND transporter periplasmic adaptor subunit [Pseudomonas sp. MPDS]WNZ81143.1 efflux RND transporter periplasmic adaptor subunit [Pseudomonas sp. P105]SIS00561.1 membrane fusion protein, multidrug efflux system [Pseudomonas sp.